MTIAVFLDRDGTLNEEAGYIRNVDDLRLIPGAAQAISRLNRANILTVLTTNQTGAARGYYDEAHIRALNARLATLLREEGDAWLDEVLYCPHYPEAVVAQYKQQCDCRKPGPGMVQEALRRHPAIDTARSYVLGDKATDVEFAQNTGCKGILLRTGYGEAVLKGDYQQLTVQPYLICNDIVEAVDRILQEVA